MPPKPLRRCAIYTRKSSDEGLEQEFNSLHAQREACESFIRSQKSEGWRLVETAYDDGGLSGGNMERPGLKQLLADIQFGRIDTVVVYKVDRLTRSLADFAKMVEVFDARGVSFVAVTQQFNTTSSMGRLTLNILLSFAQFEREVTGERIRDKIAASKQKGMWMGGMAPLGYDVQDKKLVVNPKEAETVGDLFRTYLDLGCVRLLKKDLDRRGIRSKQRIWGDGQPGGGSSFSRGALYAILANPIYVGEIRHKGVNHPGQHEAILDRALWASVQDRLATNGTARAIRKTDPEASLLAGKLFDEAGQRLTPSHAVKNGRRYRYYVSRALLADGVNDKQQGWRLPARETERMVAAAVCSILADRSTLAGDLRDAGIEQTGIPPMLDRAAAIADRVKPSEAVADCIDLVERVDLQSDGIAIAISMPGATAEQPITITRQISLTMKRRGAEMRMVIDAPGGAASAPDPMLLKTLARAHRWLDELLHGAAVSIGTIAERERLNDRYVSRVLRLAFLAPDITRAIIDGSQPVDLTAEMLIRRVELPFDWSDQKELLGV